MHVIVLPEKDGKLNAKNFLGGRKKLSGLQDSYHKWMVEKGFELERGIRGSTARHIPLKRYYEAVNSPLPKLKEKEFEVLESKKLFVSTTKKINALVKDEAIEMLRIQAKKNRAIQQNLDSKTRQNSKLNKSLKEERKLADQLREISLLDVCEKLELKFLNGLWHSTFHDVSIDGRKFYDEKAEHGGRGAIDLVMHCLQCSYDDALAWLAGNFHVDIASASQLVLAKEKISETMQNVSPKTFVLPQKCPENDEFTRELLQQKQISAGLIDHHIHDGTIYSDLSRRIVFVGWRRADIWCPRTDDFCTLPGSARMGRGFMAGDEKIASHIALTSNPIEALSYVTQYPDCAALSVSDSSNFTWLLKTILKRLTRPVKKIIAAFASDPVGEVIAEKTSHITKSLDIELEVRTPKTSSWVQDAIERHKEKERLAAENAASENSISEDDSDHEIGLHQTP